MPLPTPRRIRNRDHVRLVAKQPCLVCGRWPADNHHLHAGFKYLHCIYCYGAIPIMKVEFVKWGNSLALRVPKAFAQDLGASVGNDGKLVIEVAKYGARKESTICDRSSSTFAG
jgi:antitoxin MazE